MNPQDIAKKYGASFNTEDISKKYGASFSPTNTEPQKKKLPLLTKESGGFGTALKDVAVGAGKGLLRGARDLAGAFQGAGQRVIAGFSGKPIEEVQATTGIKSLGDKTSQGQMVTEQLKPKSVGEKVGGVLETVAEVGTGFTVAKGPQAIQKARQGYTAYKEGKAGEKVTEMISPKPTVKQAQLAQTQGRLIEGKKPTLFKSGTEDSIAPSQKTQSASQTIVKNIPNASKMSPSELYKAVDENITNTATKLRPQMEATPIKPETVQKLNTDWESLKKSQVADAPATEEINVIKRQGKFESLLKKSGSNTHADLWDTAINYDNSIPDAVKKANSLSSESLQIQKQEWLDNRKILSDAIEKSSRPEFKQMSDMYEAKNGILSKTKIDKAQASKLKQLVKKHPEVAGTIKLVIGIEAFRRIFGVNIP